MPVIPAAGRLNRKVVVQASLGRKGELISKITRAKEVGGMVLVGRVPA
jgi:hypothetical protein